MLAVSSSLDRTLRLKIEPNPGEGHAVDLLAYDLDPIRHLLGVNIKPNVGWSSIDGSLPQTFVIELPSEFAISRFSFDNATQEAKYLGISAKDIQIFVSLEAEDLGYQEVGTFTLRKGEIAQGFKLSSPVRARWIKLKILSNHGNADYTELMEFRAIGVPD